MRETDLQCYDNRLKMVNFALIFFAGDGTKSFSAAMLFKRKNAFLSALADEAVRKIFFTAEYNICNICK